MHYLNLSQYNWGPFAGRGLIIIGLVTIWSLIWKGLALWRAAQNKQKGWYVALLVLNTAGILEIIYLLFFSNPDKNKKKKA